MIFSSKLFGGWTLDCNLFYPESPFVSLWLMSKLETRQQAEKRYITLCSVYLTQAQSRVLKAREEYPEKIFFHLGHVRTEAEACGPLCRTQDHPSEHSACVT